VKVTCSKCEKITDGFNGNTAAYILFGLTVPLIYLFGISMISVAGLGVYVLLVHGSSNFFCNDCLPSLCPGCGEELTHKNHCRKCEIAICPFCGSYQPNKRPLSLVSTAVGFLFFIVGLAIIIGLFLIDFMWMILFVLALLYLSSPVCKTCGKRIHTEVF
jgi:hypothetical protein